MLQEANSQADRLIFESEDVAKATTDQAKLEASTIIVSDAKNIAEELVDALSSGLTKTLQDF